MANTEVSKTCSQAQLLWSPSPSLALRIHVLTRDTRDSFP